MNIDKNKLHPGVTIFFEGYENFDALQNGDFTVVSGKVTRVEDTYVIIDNYFDGPAKVFIDEIIDIKE